MKLGIYSLSLLVLALAERSQEDNEEANPAIELANDNSDDADPFVSSLAEEPNEIVISSSDLMSSISNDLLSSSFSAESTATAEASQELGSTDGSRAAPGSLDSLSLSEEGSEVKGAEEADTSNGLFGIGNDKPKEVSSKYWTELVIDNKSKNVLVNIKTVTIIESMKTVEAKPATVTMTRSTSDSEGKFPYIKIQMPSSTSTSVSKSVTSKSATTKTATVTSRSVTTATSKGLSTASKATVKSTSTLSKTATAAAKSTTSKTVTSASKKTSSLSKAAPKTHYRTVTKYEKVGISSTKKSTVSTTARSTTSVATTTAKSTTTTAPKTISTTVSTTQSEGAGSVGSIFNVLKNMPAGGPETSSLYIEGSFKFPKKKEISNRIYKLSGYISQA